MKQDVVYQGFGFPVLLKNVEFLGIGADTYMDVRHEELAKRLRSILFQLPHAWTLAELRFMRKELNLTRDELDGLLRVAPGTVLAWDLLGSDTAGFMGIYEKGFRGMIARKWLDLETRIALAYQLGPINLSTPRSGMLSIEM